MFHAPLLFQCLGISPAGKLMQTLLPAIKLTCVHSSQTILRAALASKTHFQAFTSTTLLGCCSCCCALSLSSCKGQGSLSLYLSLQRPGEQRRRRRPDRQQLLLKQLRHPELLLMETASLLLCHWKWWHEAVWICM